MNISFTPPQTLALSANPVPVAIQSTDYVADAGTAATASISVTAAIGATETLSIAWSSAALNFIFRVSPVPGLELPSGNGNPAHVTDIITWLNKNYYLNTDFLITQGTTSGSPNSTIHITARELGIVYNLTITNGIHMASSAAPGTNYVQQPNFKHFIEVLRKGSTDTRLAAFTLQLDYPVTGTTTYNLQQILHPALGFDIPLAGTVWQPCTLSFMEYYLRYAQYFGDKPEVKGLYTTDSFFVYRGGYSYAALGVIAGNDHFQLSLLPLPGLYQFQRWMETFPVDTFTIRTNTPQFLYFINNRNVSETLDISVTMSFSNAAAPVTIVIPGGELAPFHKVCINCGYQALGLPAHTTPTVQVISYTVQLIERASGTSRSLVKTFNLDRTHESYTRYILYSDSAGNFKTLHTRGTSAPSTTITDALAYRFPDQNTPKTGMATRYNILATDSDEINTGYMSARELDQVKELLMAEKAFRVFGDVLVPILITAKDKFNWSADGQNLNAAKIQYQLNYQDAVYTGSTGALVVPELNRPQESLNI